MALAFMGYYNFQQRATIEVLNEEILEQARLRHNLILKTHILDQQIEEMKNDSANLD